MLLYFISYDFLMLLFLFVFVVVLVLFFYVVFYNRASSKRYTDWKSAQPEIFQTEVAL